MSEQRENRDANFERDSVEEKVRGKKGNFYDGSNAPDIIASNEWKWKIFSRSPGKLYK